MGIVAATHQRVHESRFSLDGHPARVFTGGCGPALLLIHGGWGGAAMHWSAVWEQLALDYQVIAPELPGIGQTSQRPLGSIRHYAAWLEHLLDHFKVQRAWCVGNSFGAAVAWRFAAQSLERCLGVVLVNGLPVPRTPLVLHWLGRYAMARALLRSSVRRNAYTPRALTRGFADPRHAPAELRELLSQANPPQLDALVQSLLEGDEGPAPATPPLLLWGAADHLPGTRFDDATRLHSSLRGSTLSFIPHAGHLPQAERPDLFIQALERFTNHHGATA